VNTLHLGGGQRLVFASLQARRQTNLSALGARGVAATVFSTH
jgi:hypothetical protein